MSGFKNIGIVGVGHIGSYILDELLKAKSSGTVDRTVVLTRPESVDKLQSYASSGATIAPIADYNDVSAVSEALKGIDVVISTIGAAATQLQIPIAEAAKAAGVRLFIPSEFGGSTDGAKQGHSGMKVAMADKIASILPMTKFYTGVFSDFIFEVPYAKLHLKSGSVTVGGDGNAEMSFTSRPDVARYVVYVLTMLSSEETVNKTFRIESQRLSFNEIFDAYEKKNDTKLDKTYIPVEELKGNLEKNPRDIISWFQLNWASGNAVVGDPNASDNAKFPQWNPAPVIEYL